jgi:hypothetical protein
MKLLATPRHLTKACYGVRGSPQLGAYLNQLRASLTDTRISSLFSVEQHSSTPRYQHPCSCQTIMIRQDAINTLLLFYLTFDRHSIANTLR